MNIWDRSKKISLVLAAALVFSGCGAEAESTQQEASSAIAVKAVEADLGTLAVSNQFVGTVSPQQQVSIVPLVSGEVDEVYAEIGDEVQAGDVLFHIKDDAARLQKESAELSKQGAELSAQMQLGSAQVMNNISMQSNIRSLEYQLEMAKDQYNSAVNGIADAQEAKDKMNGTVDEINRSVNALQNDQKKMEEVINRAKEYVTYDFLKGEYVYETVYDRPQDPDHYTWKDEMKEQDTQKTENGDGNKNGADENNSFSPVGGSSMSGAGFSSYEKEPSIQGSDVANEEKDKQSESAESVPEENAGAAEGQEQQAESVSEEAESGPAAHIEETEGEKGTEAEDVAYADGLSGYTYFSVEMIREDVPRYLADGEGNDPYTPKLSETTRAEAWDKYKRQQKINAAKSAAEEMGYSAEDIGSGKAQAELLENSAQIVALQYQASQLQSNQASVDSSIKSAESAKDTTAKTIDFYEDNLQNAQVTYGISNGQAYQDTAGALATQIQAADVGVRSAQMQLEYYSPTTPISGTVVSKTVEQYGLVQPGYAAYVISNQDAMNVTFAVSGQVKETLQVGMPVTLEKSGSTYAGTITEIGETVDQQSGGLFLVKAITEADGDKLAGGTAVKLTVDTYRTENAILIPYDAVHFESEQAYVFAIIDHKAVRTPVTIGLMSDDVVEITEGLAAGTQVVATWSSQLEDGVEVRIIGEKQSAAAKAGAEAAESDSDTAETYSETLSGEAEEAEE